MYFPVSRAVFSPLPHSPPLQNFASALIPYELISAGVFAMLIGMMLHPLAERFGFCREGIAFTSKKILKGSIVLMGITLSFSQVLEVGKFSLIVMCFTLTAAFGFGNLFGRMFGMNWKLSNLISAGTGICGGSAIAAISPTIDADDSDIAYAISATFLFDIVMVILFPIMGRAAGMSDMGFGLWAGTAVNDTSSVVAAGYAFSDLAGQFSTIVKLTRHPLDRSHRHSLRLYQRAGEGKGRRNRRRADSGLGAPDLSLVHLALSGDGCGAQSSRRNGRGRRVGNERRRGGRFRRRPLLAEQIRNGHGPWCDRTEDRFQKRRQKRLYPDAARIYHFGAGCYRFFRRAGHAGTALTGRPPSNERGRRNFIPALISALAG